jgi:stage II sporulation protein R
MKKIIPIVLIIVILLSKNNVDGKILIPEESIRLRVLANSNSVYDQQIKSKVKNNLQYQMYNLLKDTTDIEEARNLINSNIDSIDSNVRTILEEENYTLGYKIDFNYHEFPEKEYKGVVYKKGKYESLLVTLGKGEGDNWWCVLFPPLCLLEAEESEKDEVEYKSFVMELLDNIFKK